MNHFQNTVCSDPFCCFVVEVSFVGNNGMDSFDLSPPFKRSWPSEFDSLPILDLSSRGEVDELRFEEGDSLRWGRLDESWFCDNRFPDRESFVLLLPEILFFPVTERKIDSSKLDCLPTLTFEWFLDTWGLDFLGFSFFWEGDLIIFSWIRKSWNW